MPADILLIGVDSLSRSILQNRLPNLHKYLQDKSPFVEMKGFLSYGVSPHSSMFPFLAAGEKIPVEFLNVSGPIDPSDKAMTSTMKILEGLRYVTFYGEDVNHRISAISNPAETRPHPFEFNVDTTYNINDIILATKVSNEMGSFHVTRMCNCQFKFTFLHLKPITVLLPEKFHKLHAKLYAELIGLL